MTIQTTARKISKLAIVDTKSVDKLVFQAVKHFYKTNWPMALYHTFGEMEDAVQVGWTRLIESKQARKILESGVEGNEGLIITIVKRGLVDYMRTMIGREESNKKQILLHSTYYMNYYEHDEYGYIDLDFEDDSIDIERVVDVVKMKKEISDFLNRRINQKDKMAFNLYNEGLSMREIGDRLDITEGRVSQILTKVNQKVVSVFRVQDN